MLSSLGDSFKQETTLKSKRKEDLAQYPARPPLRIFVNQANAIHPCINTDKHICQVQLVSFTVRTSDLHKSPQFQLQICPSLAGQPLLTQKARKGLVNGVTSVRVVYTKNYAEAVGCRHLRHLERVSSLMKA